MLIFRAKNTLFPLKNCRKFFKKYKKYILAKSLKLGDKLFNWGGDMKIYEIFDKMNIFQKKNHSAIFCKNRIDFFFKKNYFLLLFFLKKIAEKYFFGLIFRAKNTLFPLKNCRKFFKKYLECILAKTSYLASKLFN